MKNNEVRFLGKEKKEGKNIEYYYTGKFLYHNFSACSDLKKTNYINVDLKTYCCNFSKNQDFCSVVKNKYVVKNIGFIFCGYIKINNNKINGFYVESVFDTFIFIPKKEEADKLLKVFGRKIEAIKITEKEINKNLNILSEFYFKVINDLEKKIMIKINKREIYLKDCGEIVVVKETEDGRRKYYFYFKKPKINLTLNKIIDDLSSSINLVKKEMEKEYEDYENYSKLLKSLTKLNKNEIKSIFAVVYNRAMIEILHFSKFRLKKMFKKHEELFERNEFKGTKNKKIEYFAKARVFDHYIIKSKFPLFYYIDDVYPFEKIYKKEIDEIKNNLLKKKENIKVWIFKK